MNEKKQKLFRYEMYFWTLFIGLGAVGGALCMLIDPAGEATGMKGLLPGLQKMPFADMLFQNLTFSGISLLIVNGLTQLAAFYLLLKRKPFGVKMCLICGCLLMAWICIQFIIFPFNGMSTAYFIFGLLETGAALGYMKAAKNK